MSKGYFDKVPLLREGDPIPSEHYAIDAVAEDLENTHNVTTCSWEPGPIPDFAKLANLLPPDDEEAP